MAASEGGATPGAGSTPAQPGGASSASSLGSAPTPTSLALIVDDDDRVRAMLVELLSKAGFQCMEAADGEQALRILDDHTPHLSILDLALPGMTGAELAWNLRSRLPEAPIVALSGHLGVWDSDDLKDLGFDRIFPKPMDCDDFVDYCRSVSGRGPAADPC